MAKLRYIWAVQLREPLLSFIENTDPFCCSFFCDECVSARWISKWAGSIVSPVRVRGNKQQRHRDIRGYEHHHLRVLLGRSRENLVCCKENDFMNVRATGSWSSSLQSPSLLGRVNSVTLRFASGNGKVISNVQHMVSCRHLCVVLQTLVNRIC